jgi:hypothetical protein
MILAEVRVVVLGEDSFNLWLVCIEVQQPRAENGKTPK